MINKQKCDNTVGCKKTVYYNTAKNKYYDDKKCSKPHSCKNMKMTESKNPISENRTHRDMSQ